MIRTEVHIPSANRVLAADLYVPDEATGAAIIFGHGYGSNRTALAEYAATITAVGAVYLAYDLSGHGESKSLETHDELTSTDHIADMVAVHEFVVGLEEVDPHRIGLAGSSFSGNTAIRASEFLPNVKHVLLQAGALYEDRINEQRRYYDPVQSRIFRSQVPIPQCASLEAAAKFTGELTYVESGLDAVIPPTVGTAYLQTAQNSKYILLPKADHELHGTLKRLFGEVVLREWVEKL